MVRQRPVETAAHEVVEARQERGERLARAGRRGDQHVLAGADARPAIALRRGRRTEAVAKPAADKRMEGGEHVVHAAKQSTAPPRKRQPRDLYQTPFGQ